MQENTSGAYRKLAKDTGLFAISNFASKILVFFLTPLYTYVLTVEEYGVVDLINTTIHFIYPILTVAIADATLRFALEKSADKSAVLNNSLLITTLASVVLMLLYPVMASLSSVMREFWIVFVVNFTLFNIQECFANFLKGIGKTKLFAVQGVVHTITIILCNILLLLVFKQGLSGYLLSIILGHLIPVLLMFFGGRLYRHWNHFRLDKKLLAEMLKYSIPMVPTLLAWAVNTSIDKYMIIGFLGLGQSGIYSVAHKIPTILTTVLAIFTQAWQLSAIANHGSDKESEYYTTVYRGLNLVSVLGCMVIIAGTKPLARILFAKDFYVAWRCVPLLTIAAMFSSHAGFLAAAFRASKKTRGLMASVLVGAAFNAALNAVLIRCMGIVGAAIGTLAGFAVLWMVRLIKVQKIVQVKVPAAKTAVEYALMLLSAVWVTFEMPLEYVVLAISFVIIVAMNGKQMKTTVDMVRQALRKKLRR